MQLLRDNLTLWTSDLQADGMLHHIIHIFVCIIKLTENLACFLLFPKNSAQQGKNQVKCQQLVK